MWGVQLKRAVVYGAGVALIAGGAHLPPHERPFCWLATGPARPSDAAAGLLARLSLQPSSPPATQLLILKVRKMSSLSPVLLVCSLSHILCTSSDRISIVPAEVTPHTECLSVSQCSCCVFNAAPFRALQPATHCSVGHPVRLEYVCDPCGGSGVSQTRCNQSAVVRSCTQVSLSGRE